MPRPLRVEYPGAWYYVTNTGSDGQPIFTSDEDKVTFLTVLNETTQLYALEIHAYCLFNKQYHLLVHTPSQPLSRAMRHINSVYTQRLQNQGKLTGPLFKGRYKSILLDAPNGYVQRMGRFIHQLPLQNRHKAPLFKYPWSSYPDYLQERTHPNWLKVSHLLSYHHGQHKLKSFYDYTENGSDDELTRFYQRKKWKPQLGTPKINTSFSSKNHTETDNKTIIPMEDIIQSTAHIFNESIPDIIESRRGRTNKQLGRTVAMYLCRHVGHYEIKAIADTFNVSHFSSVTVRLKRFQKTLDTSPSLRSKLNLLKQTVGRFKI